MNSFLHLSDPHFGTENPLAEAALSSKIKELKPRAILLTGDITQRARKRQFMAASDFLARLDLPVLCIPGNHDLPLFDLYKRFTAPYENFQFFFPRREPLMQTGSNLFLGLDATSPFRHKSGALNADYVTRKVEEARKLPDISFFCLCIHQPLLVCTRKDQRNRLSDAESFVKLFSALKIDLVLSGHIHLPLVCTSARFYQGLSWDFVFSGAGTCLSNRVRKSKPNSFNEIIVNSSLQEMTIKQYDLDSASRIFSKHSEHLFKKNAKGWLELSG